MTQSVRRHLQQFVFAQVSFCLHCLYYRKMEKIVERIRLYKDIYQVNKEWGV